MCQRFKSRGFSLTSLIKVLKHRFSLNHTKNDQSQAHQPDHDQRVIRRYVVIGNGISGVEASKRIRTLDENSEIIMISRESTLHWSRPALMYLFMGELSLEEATPYPRSWFERHRITLQERNVVRIEREKRELYFSDHHSLTYDVLLIAVGSSPRRLPIPHASHERIMGLYHLQDIERLDRLSQGIDRAVIVGGGLIAVEWAEMLLSRGIEVEVVVRDELFASHILQRAEARIVTEHMLSHGVKIHARRELIAINEGEEEKLLNVTLSSGEVLEVGLVCVAIGVEPAIKGLEGIDPLCDRGILVDARMQSSDPHIFAAGDCAEFAEDLASDAVNRISGTWYESRLMGRVAGESMVTALYDQHAFESAHELTLYKPSDEQWFNSAKFFDIEYQEYGTHFGCSPHEHELRELSPNDTVQSFSNDDKYCLFWRHPTKERTLRLIFSGGVIIGFASLGIRLRQKECERFMRSNYRLNEVLDQLLLLRFDEEFNDTLKRAQLELMQLYV